MKVSTPASTEQLQELGISLETADDDAAWDAIFLADPARTKRFEDALAARIAAGEATPHRTPHRLEEAT